MFPFFSRLCLTAERINGAAFSMSSSVVDRPNESRSVPKATLLSTFIAVSTCEIVACCSEWQAAPALHATVDAKDLTTSEASAPANPTERVFGSAILESSSLEKRKETEAEAVDEEEEEG